MTIGEAFAKRLDFYLTEKGISLHKFLKESGLTQSTVIYLTEGNCKNPTLAALYDVAVALGVTVSEFLNCDEFKKVNLML